MKCQTPLNSTTSAATNRAHTASNYEMRNDCFLIFVRALSCTKRSRANAILQFCDCLQLELSRSTATRFAIKRNGFHSHSITHEIIFCQNTAAPTILCCALFEQQTNALGGPGRTQCIYFVRLNVFDYGQLASRWHRITEQCQWPSRAFIVCSNKCVHPSSAAIHIRTFT